jgi:hypothetical protein
MPPAAALLNPHQLGCGFPFKGLCSAGVAFYLCASLRSALAREVSTPLPDPRLWLDLVALGTVCDMVPLIAENRILVRHGLQVVGQRRRPGVRALLEYAGVGADEAIDEGHLGFRLGPRLNAPGRLGPAEPSLRLLRAGSVAEARAMAERVEGFNSHRREHQDEIVREALALLAADPRSEQRHGIVVGHERWLHGIVGIAAAGIVAAIAGRRWCSSFDRARGEARGSVRTHGEVDVLAALRANAPLLRRFGGHRAAAGLSMDLAEVPALIEGFDAAVGLQLGGRTPGDVAILHDGALEFAAVDEAMLGGIEGLGPYGVGFAPRATCARRRWSPESGCSSSATSASCCARAAWSSRPSPSVRPSNTRAWRQASASPASTCRRAPRGAAGSGSSSRSSRCGACEGRRDTRRAGSLRRKTPGAMLISVTPRPNLPSPRLARALAGALALALAACGLRSDADDDESGGDVDTFGDETAADPREGSCDTPYVLPFANFEVRGRLLGPGKVRGWCGRDAEDDPDAGPEDSYIVTPTFNVDVLVVIPESDFVPSLRVTKDGCREDVFPQVCATPVAVDDNWHFFAETGHSYTITIDSPEGTDGNYTMQMLYGDPGVGACPIHPSVITQKPGGFFTWSNTFGKRQGEVDGRAGVRAREHVPGERLVPGVHQLPRDRRGRLRAGAQRAQQLRRRHRAAVHLVGPDRQQPALDRPLLRHPRHLLRGRRSGGRRRRQVHARRVHRVGDVHPAPHGATRRLERQADSTSRSPCSRC